MLKSIEGKVLEVGSEYVLIDVNGLGFEINCSGSALEICANSDFARIITHVQFSENGVSLFGFSDNQELELFLKLISIKGVGGKLALTVLRSLDAESIINAAVNSEADVFQQISGIGRKTAERISFELNRYLSGKNIEEIYSSGIPSRSGRKRVTVIEALGSLGFSSTDISRILTKLEKDRDQNLSSMDESQIIKAALKELNRT
jgi:Holliday junction DNA helicase RuvA